MSVWHITEGKREIDNYEAQLHPGHPAKSLQGGWVGWVSVVVSAVGKMASMNWALYGTKMAPVILDVTALSMAWSQLFSDKVARDRYRVRETLSGSQGLLDWSAGEGTYAAP